MDVTNIGHCLRDIGSRIALWLLIEWRLHWCAGLVVVVGSLIVATKSDRSEMFARSGSIMCLTGGFMTFRRYLRRAENENLNLLGLADVAPFGNPGNPIDQFAAKEKARRNDSTAMRWGITYVLLGTIVWGYGDLFLKWVHVCQN